MHSSTLMCCVLPSREVRTPAWTCEVRNSKNTSTDLYWETAPKSSSSVSVWGSMCVISCFILKVSCLCVWCSVLLPLSCQILFSCVSQVCPLCLISSVYMLSAAPSLVGQLFFPDVFPALNKSVTFSSLLLVQSCTLHPLPATHSPHTTIFVLTLF